mgnify:CR=1 FL=1
MDIVDLHNHSIFSDGYVKPKEFVSEIYREKFILKKKNLNLRAIALTDHDSMNGIEPIKRSLVEYEEENGISDKILFLNGIELSTKTINQEVHILGYFPWNRLTEIDSKLGAEIQDNMTIRNNFYRFKQMPLLLELIERRLSDLTGRTVSYDIGALSKELEKNYQEFRKTSFDSKSDLDYIQWILPFPRSLIRKVLAQLNLPIEVITQYMKRTDPENILESFYLDLNRKSESPLLEEQVRNLARGDVGKYIYIEEITKNYMPTERAVELINSVNGKSFFAHPYELINKNGKKFFETFVHEILIPSGLGGIECYYPDHSPELINYLIKFSKANGLLISGGTDNHFKGNNRDFLITHVSLKIPFELYEQIIKPVGDFNYNVGG